MMTRGLMVLTLVAAVLTALVLPRAARAHAQPEPTIELLPASGPCDAAIQVNGSGFGPPRYKGGTLRLYLVQPGTTDLAMRIETAPPVEGDGTFVAWLGPGDARCEAAWLDSESEEPRGHLLIVASSNFEETGVGLGERIPDIIASAQYEYTTTRPHVSTETLTIFPASGPCDGMVEVTGSGFEPGLEVLLNLGRPGSDASLGTLASTAADDSGGFTVRVQLGELGCEAARIYEQTVGDPARRVLGIAAYRAVYPTPVPPGIPAALAVGRYTFTTVTMPGSPAPEILPATGTGPETSWGAAGRLVVMAPLAGLGLVLVIASLYLGRKRA